MVIKGARTIAEYRQIQAEKIQNWIDSNFVEGSVTWEMDGANAIKVTDKTGDSMVISWLKLISREVFIHGKKKDRTNRKPWEGY